MNITLTSEETAVSEYVIGYVVRRAKNLTKCESCLSSLRAGSPRKGILIEMRDYYNVLHTPCEELVSLLKIIEEVILSEVEKNGLNAFTYFSISFKVDELLLELHEVGCDEHSSELTQKIIQYFLILRMNFICRVARKNLVANEKMKILKKGSKLV